MFSSLQKSLFSHLSLEKILQRFNNEYKSTTQSVIDATPVGELWRYFVDYPAKQGLAIIVEPNYLTAITQAFHFVLTTNLNFNSPDAAVDLVKILVRIQQIAIHNVLEKKQTGFCNSRMIFYGLFNQHNTTREGFDEILEDIKKDPARHLYLFSWDTKSRSMYQIYLSGSDHTKLLAVLAERPQYSGKIIDISTLSKKEIDVFYNTYVKESDLVGCNSLTIATSAEPDLMLMERESRVKEKVETFLTRLTAAKSKQDKLTAIAILTADLVRYHPFQDGNARSIAILFLNLLLKENGLPPAIVNPNFSGGYTFAQWENEILNGMSRALRLSIEKKFLFFTSTGIILANAAAKQKADYHKAVKIENINRKIRKFSQMSSDNECIVVIKDRFEELMYEGSLTEEDMASISRTCTAISMKDNVKIYYLVLLLNHEIETLSSKTSHMLFSAVMDARLQNVYKQILATIKQGSPKALTQLDSVLQEYQEEYKSSANLLVETIPSDEMWRFFIDFPAKGGLVDFIENNYVVSLMQAFHFVLTLNSSHFEDDLVTTLIKTRKFAIKNVLKQPLGFSHANIVSYGVCPFNTTREGFDELLEDVKADSARYIMLFIKQNRTVERIYLAGPDQSNLLTLIDDHPRWFGRIIDVTKIDKTEIDDYYKRFCIMSDSMGMDSFNIADAKTREMRVKSLLGEFEKTIVTSTTMKSKLTAIATLTARLVRYHPFDDGNARSIAILLLNLLLKDNGFPPAIINPNFSGGYSFKQWEEEIVNGMERVLQLAKASLTCISTKELLADATAQQICDFDHSVKIENINRRIRKLAFANEFVENVKCFLEDFMYEGDLEDPSLESIARVFSAINDNTSKEKLREIIGLELVNQNLAKMFRLKDVYGAVLDVLSDSKPGQEKLVRRHVR